MQARSLSMFVAALTLSVLVACGPARGGAGGGGTATGGGGGGSGTGGGTAAGGGSGGGSGGGQGGGTPFTCAQSCAGCCDSAGVCQLGTAGAACGIGGASCASCAATASCVSNACRTANCATCTLAAACQSTLSNTVCGSGGIACLDCAASGGATCNLDAGVCTGGTCAGCRDATGACLGGNTKGACGVGGGSCSSCGGSNVCVSGACMGTGNFAYDGGTTISAIRGAAFCSEKVKLKNVVITSIANSFAGTAGDYQAQFWVGDPAKLKDGIYVDKFFTDPSIPAKFEPKTGQIVDIEGYTFKQSKFTDRIAYRVTLKSQFSCIGPDGGFYNPAGPLTVTLIDAGTLPAAPMAPAGFGNAMGGTVKANSDYRSARVFVPGPLTITNPSPQALKRVSLDPTDTTYFGFEVTGGILVNNFNTFDRFQADAGLQVRCDYRKMMLDGGSVVFPNGITAVYDTYSHASCEDGGTSCPATARRNAGIVPGTTNDFTYVLYPADCTELVGQYDAGQ